MKPSIYLVGGAVRDTLLGLDPRDRDYVVVGATPEWMASRGFSRVGASFPVYIHPETGDEYALARQERKSGAGHRGFDVDYNPDVTLEEDLARRDLTINSMAMDGEGNIVDPFDGAKDLRAGVLRHTSPAFADDPLRVLRLARFAARYGFSVHESTVREARRIVESGEMESLPRERVWSELYSGFGEDDPCAMVRVLVEVGAVTALPVSEYFPLDVEETLANITHAISNACMADNNKNVVRAHVNFLLLSGRISSTMPESEFEAHMRNLRVPIAIAKMATAMDAMRKTLASTQRSRPEDLVELLEKIDYTKSRNSHRIGSIIHALLIEEWFYGPRSLLVENLKDLDAAAEAVSAVNSKSIASTCSGVEIGRKIRDAKVAAVKSATSREIQRYADERKEDDELRDEVE